MFHSTVTQDYGSLEETHFIDDEYFRDSSRCERTFDADFPPFSSEFSDYNSLNLDLDSEVRILQITPKQSRKPVNLYPEYNCMENVKPNECNPYEFNPSSSHLENAEFSFDNQVATPENLSSKSTNFTEKSPEPSTSDPLSPHRVPSSPSLKIRSGEKKKLNQREVIKAEAGKKKQKIFNIEKQRPIVAVKYEPDDESVFSGDDDYENGIKKRHSNQTLRRKKIAKKSTTKNLIKNFTNQVITDASKHSNINSEFKKAAKDKKKKVSNIDDLREFWYNDSEFSHCMRNMSKKFILKQYYRWIFNSQILDKRHFLKMRRVLWKKCNLPSGNLLKCIID